MEALLSDGERGALSQICAAVRIPRDRWHHSDAIAPAWEMLSVARLAADLYRRGKMTERRAVDDAARRLHLNVETVRSRWKRWPLSVHSLPQRRCTVHLDSTVSDVAA